MKLIAGLGNPGAGYVKSRHNIGFVVADRLAERWAQPELGGGGWSKRFKGQFLTCRFANNPLILLKPQTYMNLSGDSLQAVAAFYHLRPRDMIVIHDDMDLALGRIAIKQGGGHGGHNGLRSISERLGVEYIRLRLGVGRPTHDAVHHVLGSFSSTEQEAVEDLVSRAAQAVEDILTEGLAAAQNRYHQKVKKPKKKPVDPDPQSTSEQQGPEKKTAH